MVSIRTRDDDKPIEELSTKALRQRVQRGNQTLREIDAANPADVVRSGKADQTLARYEGAIDQVQEAERELASREHRSIIERLPLARALRDAARKPHPAARWLDAARRYSAPELQGERLDPTRLTEEEAAELETIVKRKREILSEEGAEPLTEDETAAWERLMGLAAGDEGLFERKRRHAQAKANIAALTEQRRLANLPKRPQYAEPGSVQLPRDVAHAWLVDEGALHGNWTLMDLGLLAGILGAFWNDDPSLFANGTFGGEGDERTLVVPGGIGSEVRMHGQMSGSPLDPENSGFIRVRRALETLAANKWIETEWSVQELRIRLGERARKLSG